MKMLVTRISDYCGSNSGRTLIISEEAIKSLGAAFLIMRPDTTVGGYGCIRHRGSSLELCDIIAVPGTSNYVDTRVASPTQRAKLEAKTHLPINLIWSIGSKPLVLSESARKVTLHNDESEYYTLIVQDGGDAFAWATTNCGGEAEIEDLYVRWEYGSWGGLATEAKLDALNAPESFDGQPIPLVMEDIVSLDDPKPFVPTTSVATGTYQNTWKTGWSAADVVDAHTGSGMTMHWLPMASTQILNRLTATIGGRQAYGLRKALMREALGIEEYPEAALIRTVEYLSRDSKSSGGLPYVFFCQGANPSSPMVFLYGANESELRETAACLSSAYYSLRRRLVNIDQIAQEKLDKIQCASDAKFYPFS